MSTVSGNEAKPIQISGDASRALGDCFRRWSGWPEAAIQWGRVEHGMTDITMTNLKTHTVHVDPEMVLLNPNRILSTVTPFRLRQEAVLTGVLGHEAAHARYSTWMPRGEGEMPTHSNGSVPSVATIMFAMVLEEPRIEGHMHRDASANGFGGLSWTMQAAVAKLLPKGVELTGDPHEDLLSIIRMWVLLAGRWYARNIVPDNGSGKQAKVFGTDLTLDQREPLWVQELNSVVAMAARAAGVDDHLTPAVAWCILHLMMLHGITMKQETANAGYLLDNARDILHKLFPNVPPEDQPQAQGAGCGGGKDEEADSGEGEGEKGEKGQGSGSGEPGDPDEGEGESDPVSGNGEGSEGEESEGSGSGAGSERSEAEKEATDLLAQALEDLQSKAMKSMGKEAAEESKTSFEKSDPQAGTLGAGGKGVGEAAANPELLRIDWREPGKDDRELQASAERFLRNLLDTSESSKDLLADTPSSRVDGAAMASWRARGSRSDPRFFVHTARAQAQTPPVRCAILVDTSGSMNEMQEPSSLLSWALAAAALDLRNFAGRGQQVESCLIHWGSRARVIQHPGELLPGIGEAPCVEMTSALPDALKLVEEEMPGFFDGGEHPTNRLLVNFTDWEISNAQGAQGPIRRLLSSGGTMLSVVPQHKGRMWALESILGNVTQWGQQRQAADMFPDDMGSSTAGRGSMSSHSHVIRFSKGNHHQMWDAAADLLNISGNQRSN
jgi:hypothetical protein